MEYVADYSPPPWEKAKAYTGRKLILNGEAGAMNVNVVTVRIGRHDSRSVGR